MIDSAPTRPLISAQPISAPQPRHPLRQHLGAAIPALSEPAAVAHAFQHQGFGAGEQGGAERYQAIALAAGVAVDGVVGAGREPAGAGTQLIGLNGAGRRQVGELVRKEGAGVAPVNQLAQGRGPDRLVGAAKGHQALHQLALAVDPSAEGFIAQQQTQHHTTGAVAHQIHLAGGRGSRQLPHQLLGSVEQAGPSQGPAGE